MTETETGGAFPAWHVLPQSVDPDGKFMVVDATGLVAVFEVEADALRAVAAVNATRLPLPPAPGKGGDSDV